MKWDEALKKSEHVKLFETALFNKRIEVFAAKDLAKKRAVSGVSWEGETATEHIRIAISTELLDEGAEADLLEILIHEFIHAIEMSFGLNFKETVVRTLGLGLAHVLLPHFSLSGASLQQWRDAVRSAREQSE